MAAHVETPQTPRQSRFRVLTDSKHFPALVEKVRFATFCGEKVYIILEGRFGATEADDIAQFIQLCQQNDYCRIVVDVSAALPTKHFFESLVASKVELITNQPDTVEAADRGQL